MRGVRTPGPSPTRAVIFSLGALCSRDHGEGLTGEAFTDAMERFAIRGDPHELFPIFAARFSQVVRWYQEMPFYQQCDMLRDARLAGLRALGVQPTHAHVHELDGLQSGAMAARMRARPGAVDLLAALGGRDLRVGVIGNIDCRQFRGTLANAGLLRFSDATLCSEEAGSCTPDPVIFYEILRRLDVRPCEALFVGASLADVRGARVVGLPSALFATEAPRGRDDSGFAPDHLVATLHEVSALVTRPAPAGDAGRPLFADHRRPLSLAD